MKIRIALLAAAGGLAFASACPAYYITGQMLKDSLEAAERLKSGDSTPQDEKEAQFGRGFVAGVADAALDGDTYCSPADASLGQINEVGLRYLRAHPESLPKTASSVMLAALIAAYPCKK